jgi:arabinofuranosyltransferase
VVTVPDLLVDDTAVTGSGPSGGPDGPAGSGEPAGPHGPEGTDSDRPSHRALQVAVLALPVLALAVLAWTHRSMFFDGYIYLHVVQNVLAGHGPVFNAGQRVEAFTSPLWTGVLSLAGLVTPFSLTTLAVDLGILLTVSGLAVAVVSSTRLVRRAAPHAFVLPLGALVFVAVSPVWSLASLGLETGLVFFWLGCCLAVLVRWAGADGREVPWYGLVVLGLGPVVRPELSLDTVVFLALLLLVDGGCHSWRRRVAVLAWAFALPLAYEVFRMGYYGMVVANTAVAKEASMPRPGQGVRYLTDFLTPYWLVVPAAALLVGAYLPLSAALRSRPGATRNRVALVALPLAAALNAGYITVMGGDYVHARLLMAPFFAACAPVAVVPLARKYALALLVVPWAVLCALTLRSSDNLPWASSPFIVVNGHGSVGAVAHDWGAPPARAAWLTPTGTYLQEDPGSAPDRLAAPPAPGLATPTVATSWIGQGPYELGPGVRFLDLLGLADPLDGHMRLSQRGLFPGHEKPLPGPWIAALMTAPGSSPAQIADLQKRRPAQYTPLIPEVSGTALAVQTAWARAALGCPTLHDLEFGPDRPLTVGTFLSDMAHAVSRTTVRVPPDPATAYHLFCGPGTPASVRAAEG